MDRSFRDNLQFKLSPYIVRVKFAGTLSAFVAILFRILAKERMQTACYIHGFPECVTITQKQATNPTW